MMTVSNESEQIEYWAEQFSLALIELPTKIQSYIDSIIFSNSF